MTFSLTVEPRTATGKKLSSLRKEGKLPVVLYGPKDEPTPLAVEKMAFEKLLKEAGESSIVTLEGLSSKKEVLIHDVAFDAARGGVIHADLYAVDVNKETTVDVPLEFIGEAPAVKLGGTLTKALHTLEITCMPKDLPSHIDIDISTLETFEDQIQVSDIKLPASVKVENDPEDVIAVVQAVEEETEEPTETVDMSAIEVEKKGKTEEEGSEAE